ncbi:OsmC family protein [Pseudomonadota bacterium]
MANLQVTYDGFQHCTAIKQPQGKTAAMDCPYTGKGEELSPANMVGAGLAGCMIISMGTLSIRDNIDINDTCVDVEIEQSEKRIESIKLIFNMARTYSKEKRTKLERAAGLCPIKSSFHPETSISVEYKYPE